MAQAENELLRGSQTAVSKAMLNVYKHILKCFVIIGLQRKSQTYKKLHIEISGRRLE